jgi:hypothetical protein
MSPDFEYFFWGNPGEIESTFVIFDSIDNRFLMQSYDHELLYKITKLMSSKITLNVLDLTHTNISATESVADNSVIENWGLEKVPPALTSTSPQLYFKGLKKNKTVTDQEPLKLKQFDTPLADYMVDLQKQLFLFAKILDVMAGIGQQENGYSYYDSNVIDYQPTYMYLKNIVDMSDSYDQCCELLCNTDGIDDGVIRKHILIILSNIGLYYE